MLTATLLALTGSAQAQVFDIPDLPWPAGIQPPTVDAPADGASFTWAPMLMDPLAPAFRFRHGQPTTQDTNPIQADTIAFCAYIFPSEDCVDAMWGNDLSQQVFATYDVIDTRVNRYSLGGGWAPIQIGYGFEYTSDRFPTSFRNQTVSYMIGACEGSPPVTNLPNWTEENCAFTEVRDFDFTEGFGGGWGW